MVQGFFIKFFDEFVFCNYYINFGFFFDLNSFEVYVFEDCQVLRFQNLVFFKDNLFFFDVFIFYCNVLIGSNGVENFYNVFFVFGYFLYQNGVCFFWDFGFGQEFNCSFGFNGFFIFFVGGNFVYYFEFYWVVFFCLKCIFGVECIVINGRFVKGWIVYG